MYEHFTDRARKVMRLANQEAQRLNHGYVGTEHVLLGLVKEGSGVAANVLKNLDVDLRQIRREVEKICQTGPDEVDSGNLPLTPRTKKVIEYAIEECQTLGHNYVGTEHLLLGLVREKEGVAAQVLMILGLKLEDVREEVLNLLGHSMDLGEMPEKPEKPRPRKEPEPEPEDLPKHVLEAVRELDAQLHQLMEKKEKAIAVQNFEQAAQCRDEVNLLTRQRSQLVEAWRGKEVKPIHEFDLFIPLHGTDGAPLQTEQQEKIRSRLQEDFGGVVEFRHAVLGSLKIDNLVFEKEILIYRVHSNDPSKAVLTLSQIKEELKTMLQQDNILILERKATTL